MSRSLTLVLLLSAVVFSSAQAQRTLEIRLVRRLISVSSSPSQRNIVTLSCILKDNEGGTFPVVGLSYHYRDPASDAISDLDYELHDVDRITFMLTPDTEGEYFCRDTEFRQSTNNLDLTAYPVPDESITQTVYAAQEGEEVTLPCDFRLGTLSNLYTYKWHSTNLGIIVNGDSNVDPDKYVVTDSFSLLIKDLDNSDNDSYWCQVVVNNPGPGSSFIEVGRAIFLEVFDAVHITGTIESQVVRERDPSDPFTCVAQGTPLPTIQWTFDGSVIDVENSDIENSKFEVTNKTDGNEITSTLTVREAQTRDNAEVVCIATNQPLTQSELITDQSTANLAVLPTQVRGLVLAVAASSDFTKAFVDFNLSDPILGEALLHVRYLGEAIEESENVPYRQAMVGNTLSVHFELPSDDWEDFATFRVRVALTATNEPNPSDEMFTDSSNPITIRDSFQLTNTHIYAIIGAGAMILLVFIIVMGVICVCCCKYTCERKKTGQEKPETAPGAHGPPPPAPEGDENQLPWQANYYSTVEELVQCTTVKMEQHMYETIPAGGEMKEESKEENRTGSHVVAEGSDDEEEEEGKRKGEEEERKGKGEEEIENIRYQRLSEHLSPSSICSNSTNMVSIPIEEMVPPASDLNPPPKALESSV